MRNPKKTSLDILQSHVVTWSQDVERIRDAHPTLDDEVALIHERGQKRLKELSSNTSGHDISDLHQALLCDGQEIERLETANKENMLQQRKKVEVLVSKILKDLVDTLGLPAIQKLGLTIFSTLQERKPDAKLLGSVEPSSDSNLPAAVANATASGAVQRNYYTRSRNLPASQPAGKAAVTAKRKRVVEDGEEGRESKVSRSSRGPKVPLPRVADDESVRSWSLPFLTSADSYQCSDNQQNGRYLLCQRIKSQNHDEFRRGKSETARVMLKRDPSRGLWILVVQFPSGWNAPRTDTAVRHLAVPGLLQPASTRNEQAGSHSAHHQSDQQTMRTSGNTDSDSSSFSKGDGRAKGTGDS